MKKFFLIFFLVFFFCFSQKQSFATSDYVLPYPSFMPGSAFYKIGLIWEFILNYWSFGNIAQFKYSLKESDKYLVEAKTLFEYKQYLLATSALKRSDIYFQKARLSLDNANSEGKEIKDKKQVLKAASEKHINTLLELKKVAPGKFLWQPEKDKPRLLDIENDFDNSIKIRKLAN